MKTLKDCERVDLEEKFCYALVQDIPVQGFLIHSEYNKPKFANDIGLVQLIRPVEFNSKEIALKINLSIFKFNIILFS